MKARLGGTDGIAAVLIGVYLLVMPLLAGIPRGAVAPLVRPTEVVQLAIMAIGFAIAVPTLVEGHRWSLNIRPTEWWLGAAVLASSVVPLLWLMARSRPIDGQDLAASLPFLKYAGLYLLIRIAVRNERTAGLVVPFALGGAVLVAVVTFAQAAGIGLVLDALATWFVSGPGDLVDIGRATTTIGSSIATGSYLALACGLALSMTLGTGRARWLVVTLVLAMATLATGQIGAIIALGIMVGLVSHFHGRSAMVAALTLPVAAGAAILVRPILANRLADLDQTSGLPISWVIRWNNVTELYLPSLADGGWLLGVGPNAVIVPPDVWRDRVFLESGYLWLLWVGGVPLLVATIGFLASAWRDLGYSNRTARSPIHATRLATRAAVAMIAVMSLLDPHLTLRAEADLFFAMLAIGAAEIPFVMAELAPHRRWQERLSWRRRLARVAPQSIRPRARLQIAEGRADLDAHLEPAVADLVESQLEVTVISDGRQLGRTTVALCREGPRLHGVVLGSVEGIDRDATTLVWRAIVLCADSLRLQSLHGPAAMRPERGELRSAGRLAAMAELERSTSGKGAVSAPRHRAAADGDQRPPVRLVTTPRPPAWKRALDLVVGTAALVASAPLWAACAVAIRVTSPGPVLFRQLRIGAGGLPFQVYKFRTMQIDNDDSAHRASNRRELLEGGDAAKVSRDARVTPVGHWLRRLSLDELPQLLNVLRGEMSLVGPRPSLLWEVELFEPPARRRLSVPPGITGLWQVSGRADVTMIEMLELDLAYVEGMSPALDLRCLVDTAGTVLSGKGAR